MPDGKVVYFLISQGITRTVAGFHRLLRLKEIQVWSSCRYMQTRAFV